MVVAALLPTKVHHANESGCTLVAMVLLSEVLLES